MLNKNKLKGKIAESGMSQGAIAGLLGISANTFSSRMTGKSYFNTSEVDALCEILGIDDYTERSQIFLPKASQNRDNQSA